VGLIPKPNFDITDRQKNQEITEKLRLEALAVHVDLIDLDLNKALTVPLQLFVLLLALQVKDQYLVAAAFLHHLSDHFGAGEL
jgi:hypothetical protein